MYTLTLEIRIRLRNASLITFIVLLGHLTSKNSYSKRAKLNRYLLYLSYEGLLTLLQRENTIKELQSRIKRLEKELAKTLSKVCPTILIYHYCRSLTPPKSTPHHPGPVKDDRLLHYLNQNSTSSQISSDMVSQSITQAPDRDEPVSTSFHWISTSC